MSKDVHPEPAALDEIRAEACRHLEWLRDAGVGEVELPARAPPARRGRGSDGEDPVSPREPAPEPPRPGGLAPAPASAAGERAREPRREGRYSPSDKGCGSDALLAVREELGECSRCKLAAGRTKLVFGVGRPDADLVFVGEGPGADEDAQGEPFVGKAGQLLTRMIEAMGLRREDVYIANVVKCRPPGNRDPEPDEIAACEPFLKAQIAALSPRIIVALGRFAVQTLLRDPTPITRQRGRWREYEGVKLMPTFHPAYLLRNPAEKKKAWEDLQLVMKELPGKSGA